MVKKVEEKLPPLLNSGINPELLLHKIHGIEWKVASVITAFSGSMRFVYLHVIWFTLWVLVNHGVFEPTFTPFDPFPYGLLTMIVSLEAIFLSTFIMIAQNRQALIETYRELEEEKEDQEAEEEVEDIQKDLDDIKSAITFIQQKVSQVEKAKAESNGNGNEHTPPKTS